jgi:hypothetical protein
MSRFAAIDAPATIGDSLKELLADELGSYARPNQSDVPAFWVADRPVPKTWSVRRNPTSKPLIPALEAILSASPQLNQWGHNLIGNAKIEADYRLMLLWHDSRQRTDPALEIVLDNYYVEDLPPVTPATDLYAAQITLLLRV